MRSYLVYTIIGTIADVLTLHAIAILALSMLTGHGWVGLLNLGLSGAVALWRACR